MHQEEPDSIPVHILNHIDAKFTALDNKINALTLSINSWMEKEPCAIVEKCEKMIDECIPTSPTNVDATPLEKRKEHRTAHANWMRDMHEEVEKWKKIRQKALEWVTVSALGGLTVWIMWSIQQYIGK